MTAVATYHPVGVEDLAGLIAEAAARGDKLEIRGGGSKAGLGAPRDAAVVDMTGFSGVIDYDPAELVLTVLAGTPLAEVQALVESRGQMLAFDPFDHGPLFGAAPGAATIGGVMAAGVSGSRRLSRGAARDHLLGFKAVSGRGEVFVGGAKVVKNVTGYDLPKVACGSWGRLFALAEVTVKVLPRPPVSLTLAVEGLLPRGAVAVMSRALGSQADVAAAAHTGEGRRLTALRLDGFGPSVPARRAALEHLLADAGPVRALDEVEAQDFWGSLCTLQPLAHGPVLWRVALPARRAPELIEALERLKETCGDMSAPVVIHPATVTTPSILVLQCEDDPDARPRAKLPLPTTRRPDGTDNTSHLVPDGVRVNPATLPMWVVQGLKAKEAKHYRNHHQQPPQEHK